MSLKVDNSYSTSDALRRYNKSAESQPPFEMEPQERPPEEPAEIDPGMDRVTLSRTARALLAGKPAQAGPAGEEPSLYSERAVVRSA